MIQTLKQFTDGTRLFDAVSALLSKLNIKFDRETAEPIAVADLYDGTMPRYLTDALQCIGNTYFIGIVNDYSLAGGKSDEPTGETFRRADKYDGMFVFACDAKSDANLTRTAAAALTRAFNRIASANPVILIIRQGNLLSLSTCERMNYTQEWRKGCGEKLGKVCILRNIECRNDENHHTHRGHLDILESLSDKVYSTFEELYKHWMEVFSTELLTKKFYNELSDWYAWATKVMKFPNALDDDTDDQKYNAENGIRLVTRLIFIWFLKEKKLVPEEFFDVNEVKKLIKDFDPFQKDDGLFGYLSLESKYYKAILQNLFFATLNCPIYENSNKPLRKFRPYDKDGKPTNTGYRDPRLMRYKYYFSAPDAFLDLVNKVPFLNGGLFDCLDKDKFFLDGFSDQEKVRKALCVPDFLFFGENNDIDLSEWYDDKQKKHIKVRGLIEILKSYKFTIEENTPYEQEVSLDPELLGKVFENLLASYNPETHTTARKSTGSYYTPREIVQYMVDESLIAYLKEKVDDALESQYRQLLDYNDAEDTLALTEEQKQAIMSALYHCKVLDPACGSGAFPMGMLQQMVHVMSKLDGDNRIWKNVIETKLGQELASTIGHSEEERQELQNDINRNFDLSQNEPDYARKLYLIENCIYGVDIQTIAIQISKLRCFISLVVDQKVNDDPTDNFGIRPLPNLEARFVAANSLIGLKNDLSLADTEGVHKVREELAEANHRIFNAKTLKTKRKWRSKVEELRGKLVDELKQTGFVTDDDASLIASWDPFNQNCSSRFFDPEWMFGFKKFDIVIGNPPYIKEYDNRSAFDGFREKSPYYIGKMDLWHGFACHFIDSLKKNGVLAFIAQNNWTTNGGAKLLRKKIVEDARIMQMVDFNDYMVFGDSASIQTMIMLFANDSITDNYEVDFRQLTANSGRTGMFELLSKNGDHLYLSPKFKRDDFKGKYITFSKNEAVLDKIAMHLNRLNDKEIAQGIVFPQDFLNKKGQNLLGKHNVGDGIFGLSTLEMNNLGLSVKERNLIKPYYTSEQIHRYYTDEGQNTLWMIYTNSEYKNPNSLDDYPTIKSHLDRFLPIFTSDNKPYGLHRARKESFFVGEKIISLRKCVSTPCFSYSECDCYVTQTYFSIKTSRWNMKFLTGILNSKLISFWLRYRGKMQGENFQVDKEPLLNIPLPSTNCEQTAIITLVDRILTAKKSNPQADTSAWEAEIDKLVYALYGLTEEEIKVVAYVNLK